MTPIGSPFLTLGFAVGCEPDKWVARYNDRLDGARLEATAFDDPVAALAGDLGDASCDIALVRLPDARIDTERMHVVRLYDEQLGVAMPKDSELTLITDPSAVTDADLAEAAGDSAPMVHVRYDAVAARRGDAVDVDAVRQALQVVAANVGLVIAPRPLLKVLSGKQVAHRAFVGDGQVASVTSVAVVWPKESDSDEIQDLVGIMKGRTARSSRQVAVGKPVKKKTATRQQQRNQKSGSRKTGSRTTGSRTTGKGTRRGRRR